MDRASKLSKEDTEQTTRDDLTAKTLASLSRGNKIYTIVWHSLCNKIDQKRSTTYILCTNQLDSRDKTMQALKLGKIYCCNKKQYYLSENLCSF